MKQCFRCGTHKPIGEFYQHAAMADGHLGKCKDCTKREVSIRYRSKVGDLEWVERERARGREKYHRLYGTGPNWTSPEGNVAVKKRATTALARAIRTGRVIRPTRCGDCGKRHKKVHGHHEDYSKPLAVHWVCPLCHRKRHAIHPERVNGQGGLKGIRRPESRKWTRYNERQQPENE